MLGLLALLLLVVIFLQTDWGQNLLAREVVSRLAKDLQTKISIKHVRFHFLNRMDLEGVYLEDQKKDTLLYAGKVKVNITDWFIFKDKADLKYIGLEDAVINLNRTDSSWNYGFLAQYFAASDTVKVKKDPGIQFSLQRIELKNVAFVQKDAWKGSDMTVKVGTLNLDADEISASKKSIAVKNIELANPYFSTLSYEGKFKDTSSLPMEWDIRLAHLKITGGRFRMDNGNYTPTVAYFDGSHIDFSNINAVVDNFRFKNDTLSGKADLTTTERSGLVVKKLSTELTIQPNAFVFDKLRLQTNRSELSDYFSMRFTGKGLADFVHAVTMNAAFKNAFISSDDLAFFIPDAKTWKKNIKINGKVEGSVDGLYSHKLELWLGKNTYVNGHVSIVGLPDINKTLLNIDANELHTTYGDAVAFFPELAKVSSPNIKALSYLKFRGTFTGFVNDFVSYGTIETPLGNLATDVNLKLPQKGEPVYSGTINTEGFELGRFINNRDLGVVDFHGDLKGRSFDINKMALDIDGIIHRIRYDNYTYQNIKGKGSVTKQQFNGKFSINDPNADLDLTGLVDFSKDVPVFDATAQIRKANLKALQLTAEDIRLKGDFNLNLQGSNIANLIGTARISNAELLANGQKLSFDFLNVASYYIGTERNLSLSSNEFDGKITGDFDLTTLPSAFRLFLTRYYPAYIKPPTHYTPQDFSFDITTGTVDEYVRLIDKNLSGLNNSHLVGSLNTRTNSMTLDADVPAVTYGNYSFADVKLEGQGNLDSLILDGSVTDAHLDSNVVLPQTTFRIKAQADVSDIVLNTTSNQAVNQASFAAKLKTYSDGISVAFAPSSFMLNGKRWTIEEGGELNLRKSTVANGQVVLRQDKQEIKVETVPSADGGNWNDLHVTLQRLNLGDLSPLFIKSNKLEGLLSGSAVIENPTGTMQINADLKGEALKMDNDSVGDVVLNGRYNNTNGMLNVIGANLDTAHHIDFTVAMNLKDTANAFQDKISLKPKRFQLKLLERFLNTLFSDIDGYATGAVNIMPEGLLSVEGKVRLNDARVKVLFTGVDYTIQDTDIELKKNYLDLNGIVIKDRLGNTAKITGGIKHQGFQNMDFDVALQTVSPQMELLNTTYKDNQQFYGHAWGSGSFVMVGPQYNMDMFIDVRASSTDSSVITLPPAPTQTTGGMTGFLVEKKYGREMSETEKRGGETSMRYEVKLTATPKVLVQLILDETTQDIIHARGSGTLKITSGTTAPLRINGRFAIDEGDYNYTFQSVFPRPFVVRGGPEANNYIEWNGDPYDANINLEAVYTAKDVSFAPLASAFVLNAGATRALTRLRADVAVIAKITGKLFTPRIDFRLDFPKEVTNVQSIAFAVEQLQRNANELTKQVTFLVVTNSFAPYESTQSFNRTYVIEELAYNTISGVLYNQINRFLNDKLSRILRKNNFTLNFSGTLYNRNLLDPNAKGLRFFNQASSTLSVGKSFFNGRAILSVGGSFDVPLGQTVQQSFQILPDVSLEILLNATGSMRLTLFYRQNYDYLNGFNTGGSTQPQRYGTSISYNKEFDSFGELLFGKKKTEDSGQKTEGGGRKADAGKQSENKSDTTEAKTQKAENERKQANSNRQ